MSGASGGSQENVDLVRRAYERFNAGDVEGVLHLCDDELEFRDLPALPGSGVFIGHDAFRGWFAQMVDAFDALRFDVDDLIDAGERVVVMSHATGRGKGSGATVETHFSTVWTVHDGKAVRIVNYNDHADALAAARLRNPRRGDRGSQAGRGL